MRRLRLRVERLGADGAWQEDGGVVDVQVSSMAELCAALDGAASTSTSVLVYDTFDAEWVVVAGLDCIKDRDRLRVKPDVATPEPPPAAAAASATFSLLFEGEGLFEGAGKMSTDWRALDDSQRAVTASSIMELQMSALQAIASTKVGKHWLGHTVALSALIRDAATSEWVHPVGIDAIVDGSTVRVRRLTLAYDSVVLKAGVPGQIRPVVNHSDGSNVVADELGLSFELLRVEKKGDHTRKDITHDCQWLTIDAATGVLKGQPAKVYSYKGLVASVCVRNGPQHFTTVQAHFWIEADAAETDNAARDAEEESLFLEVQGKLRNEVANRLLCAINVAHAASAAVTNVLALAHHAAAYNNASLPVRLALRL
jgi:hypothetical protein